MATYLYKCEVCGAVFEKKFHFNDDKEEIICPKCHSEVQRVYTPPQFFLKEPGFYVNDSKSKPIMKE